MSAPTPGPWEVMPEDFTDDGYTEPYVASALNSRAICTVRVGLKETDANARLIAAAPDLLAACRLALEAFPIALRWALPSEDVDKNGNVLALRAAIAKAEGR